MPHMPSGSDERRSQQRRVLLWSVLTTILLLPLSNAMFLKIFDGGSSELNAVMFLPVLAFYYQGFLTGLIIDTCLIGCTFFPINFVVRRIFERRHLSSVNIESHECVVETRAPLSVRMLAIVDFLVAVIIAISAIDRPFVSLAVLVLTGPVVFGIFNVKPWGWWAGMIFHGLIVIGVLVAYAVAMFFLIQDFGKPTGHMELISSKAFAVMLTILVVIIEMIAVVPLFVLTRNKTRQCFLSGHAVAPPAPTLEDR
ncbi:MAG: hypothetical protein WBH28_10805 [Fuerstiella sp.]